MFYCAWILIICFIYTTAITQNPWNDPFPEDLPSHLTYPKEGEIQENLKDLQDKVKMLQGYESIGKMGKEINFKRMKELALKDPETLNDEENRTLNAYGNKMAEMVAPFDLKDDDDFQYVTKDTAKIVQAIDLISNIYEYVKSTTVLPKDWTFLVNYTMSES